MILLPAILWLSVTDLPLVHHSLLFSKRESQPGVIFRRNRWHGSVWASPLLFRITAISLSLELEPTMETFCDWHSFTCTFGVINGKDPASIKFTEFPSWKFISGDCTPSGFPNIEFNAIETLDLFSSSSVYIWMWVVASLSLLWLFSSVTLITSKQTFCHCFLNSHTKLSKMIHL